VPASASRSTPAKKSRLSGHESSSRVTTTGNFARWMSRFRPPPGPVVSLFCSHETSPENSCSSIGTVSASIASTCTRISAGAGSHSKSLRSIPRKIPARPQVGITTEIGAAIDSSAIGVQLFLFSIDRDL
jgi:hypothetical protein